MADGDGTALISGILIILVILGGIAFIAWGLPQYKIYSLEMNGKAQLKEAEWSRQILIEEAKAKKESAVLDAEAEIIRAEGIAKANEIIAGSITPEYIQYKFVEGLNDGSTEVIYVPTEANIPIMEATRMN